MRAAAKPSRKPVKRLNPLLSIVSAPPSEPLRIVQLDPLEEFRERLIEQAGILPMGCGCFAQMDESTLKTFDAKALAGATCAIAGTCCHQQWH